MDLSRLQELGGFVPPTPVKQEVTWSPLEGEPVTFTVHIKRLSAGEREKLWSDVKPNRSNVARLIHETVGLGDDGGEKLSYDQAFKLDPDLAEAFLEAVDKVNPVKKRTVEAVKN